MRQGLIITLEPVQQVSEIEREAYNGRAPPTLMGMHLEVHPVMHVDRHALRMHPGVHGICTSGAHLSSIMGMHACMHAPSHSERERER